MPTCRACRRFLRGDVETVGARCMYCREPLYEHPLASAGGTRGLEDAVCALHPANGAHGTCSRCGNFICPVCRTSWHGATVCPACVARAMDAGETVPAEKRTQWLQSLFALLLGGGAWVLTVVGFIVIAVAVLNGFDVVTFAVGSLVMLGSVIPSVMGVGFGAAAIRARGGHMIIATMGLVLGALHVGAMIGMLSMSLWTSLGE
jgi:hypothetical protein